MKKLLLTFSLAAMLLSAKSQIVITGYLADPSGTDGNLEYVQLMATQDIDFAVNKYSLVICRNGTTDAPYAGNYARQGWATAGNRTYKFDMTTGTVAKGQFFYVGGSSKKLNGASSNDIPAEKWIVSRDYTTVPSDEFVDRDPANTLNTSNGLLPNSGRAAGIAVFSTILVSSTTVPIDVLFNQETSGGTLWSAGGSPAEGYLICNNDLYKIADNPYFRGDGKNTMTIANSASISPKFIKLGGVYDLESNEWTTARSKTEVTITSTSVVADIETGAGITVLPVSLTSFTAKTNKQGSVNLAWTTASEKDNSHFEVTRSANGVDFEKLQEVKGSGNSDVVRNYSYTDTKPAVGVNYYRLKQVDFDGDFAFSGIATAKVGLAGDNLTVSVSANRSSVSVNYIAITSGKALFNIYNVSGAKIATVEQTVNVGANQINIPVNLGNAIHVLNVAQAGASASTKF